MVETCHGQVYLAKSVSDVKHVGDGKIIKIS